MASDFSRSAPEQKGGVATISKTKTRRPTQYKVLLHNDDFTAMDFVVDVLMQFFDKDVTEATRIMLLVHHTGLGLCGVYPRDIAETKVSQVSEYARDSGYPLRCSMEPQ
ncbi:MAG: ATP-dependent Clp protease adapter ClpS [Candidatus Wallbacteria bacterium]|nr:ATP-dependent Clp protease adapter ClpS [Candidatus Wallbacteria bacterium]